MIEIESGSVIVIEIVNEIQLLGNSSGVVGWYDSSYAPLVIQQVQLSYSILLGILLHILCTLSIFSII